MIYTLLIVGLALLAAAAAVILIGLAVYFQRKKNQAPKEELDAAQVDEITSTWTLNH